MRPRLPNLRLHPDQRPELSICTEEYDGCARVGCLRFLNGCEIPGVDEAIGWIFEAALQTAIGTDGGDDATVFKAVGVGEEPTADVSFVGRLAVCARDGANEFAEGSAVSGIGALVETDQGSDFKTHFGRECLGEIIHDDGTGRVAPGSDAAHGERAAGRIAAPAERI